MQLVIFTRLAALMTKVQEEQIAMWDLWGISFPFRVDHFRRGLVCREANRKSEVISLSEMAKIYQMYQAPLINLACKVLQK